MSLIEELSTHFDDDSEALDPRIQVIKHCLV